MYRSRIVRAGVVAVLTVTAGCTGSSHHSQSAPLPGWVLSCIDARSPLIHDYDGLAVSAAVRKATWLGHDTKLAGRDGHCLLMFANFVPGRVAFLVQHGKVVAAQQTN